VRFEKLLTGVRRGRRPAARREPAAPRDAAAESAQRNAAAELAGLDVAAELARLDAAFELWRGLPLPEFTDEVVRGWAARLVALHRGALADRADLLRAVGRADAAVSGLVSEVDADPC
jgi:hypothetical protein